MLESLSSSRNLFWCLTPRILSYQGEGLQGRFEEISSTIYYLEVVFIGDVLLSVLVPQNRVHDVAGNPNYASNVLRFRHYAVPSISVALYSFTTAGVLATAFTSSALAISSTCLAAAGVLDSWAASLAMTDPSRNFLGLISHIQMFAFSKWMAVSLPVDYYETVKGLQWSIPQRELPWEKQQAETKRFEMEDILLGLIESEPFIVSHRRVSSNFKSTDQYTQSIGFVKCQLETKSAGSSLLPSYPHQHLNKNLSEGEKHAFNRNENIAGSFSIVKQPKSLNQTLSERIKHYCNLWASRQQKFGANASVFGPDLSADEYSFYFKDKALYFQETVHLLSKSHYTGWQDFARNLFWLGVGGGTLILLHALLLVYLRWKTKESLRGSLSIPRLEVLVLLLALPCISQASAFVIKGGTTKGLIVGVLLLAFPAASLLSMVLFIVVAVIIREYVQYQEVKPFHLSPPWYQRILAAILGTNSTGKWVRKEGLPASFLPRFGLLIEDRRGPVKLTINARTELDRDEWVDSGSNGIGRMRPSPDIQADNLLASKLENAFGVARASYLILDISRRVTLGIIFGAYPTSDKSWIQLVVAAAFTTIQLLYLVIFKPYIRRGVQLVESLSLMCEVGIFFAGLGLLSHAHPYEDYQPLGIVMLTLFGISFTGQLANEWYALLEQLLSLSPARDTSFIGGLKMFVRGLFLPFIAHGKWEKFIALPSQPTGLVPVSHRASDLQKGKASVKSSISAEAAASVRGLPSFFGEVGFSQHHAAQGAERQKGKSTELKLLQKLAKASFPIDADASWPSSSIEDAPPVSSLQAETVDHGKQILTLVTSEQHSFNS